MEEYTSLGTGYSPQDTVTRKRYIGTGFKRHLNERNALKER